jgi:hypothetical protein
MRAATKLSREGTSTKEGTKLLLVVVVVVAPVPVSPPMP